MWKLVFDILYKKFFLIITSLILIFLWFKFGIYKADYNSMQLVLTSIIPLLATFIGIIWAVLIFVFPKINDWKRKSEHSKRQIINFFLHGKDKANDCNINEYLIEKTRLQILNWLTEITDKEIKADLVSILSETSFLCLILINDKDYHTQVCSDLIDVADNKSLKKDLNKIEKVSINDTTFFNYIENLYVAYWYRHIRIPDLSLYQNFFRDYPSKNFNENNSIVNFGNYISGKAFYFILFLSSFLAIISLFTLSFITKDNYIKGLHILSISCSTILFLTLLDISIITNYIFKIMNFLHNYITKDI